MDEEEEEEEGRNDEVGDNGNADPGKRKVYLFSEVSHAAFYFGFARRTL